MKKSSTFTVLFLGLLSPFLSTGQNPGNIGTANLKLWLKANDASKVVSAANLVSSWSTTFPAATPLNYTQASNANKPTYSASNVNFNPSLTSQGSAYLLSTTRPLTGSSDNFTILSVNYASVTGTIFVQPWTSLGGSNPLFSSNAGIAYSNSQSIAAPTVPSNIPVVIGATRTVGASNATMTNYLNSIQASSNSSLGLPAADALGSSSIIGRWQNSTLTTSLTGGLAELIVYDRVLTANELSRANSYLAIKYGITLGNTSNPVAYQHSAGTTTSTGIVWTASATYQNNIAGIGRDDNSGLGQKQSKSNTSGIITMAVIPAGAGSVIPAANASNTNTFSADQTFLMWGDNGLSPLAVVTDLPNTIVQKSGRTWKTQLTGTGLASQNIRVKVDMIAFANIAFGTYANYRLLLDADGVFASGSVILLPVAGSVANSTVEFDVPISLYANYYMTIGTIHISSPLPIELTRFSADCRDAGVEVLWSTASEFNNAHFTISRSSDAIHWEVMRVLKSAGNSSIETHYSATDHSPLQGISYYRLHQTDMDGTERYFDPVSVFSCSSEPEVVTFFPNPADQQMTVSIQGISGADPAWVEILDLAGRKILTQSVSGGNSIPIDRAGIPKGTYILRVTYQGEILAIKRVIFQ